MKAETILIDRYQIREQLSRKAGRRVFLAQDLQSQNLVIIKILRFDADFEWDDLKLFEREVATLKNLAHPAIPKYLDYFEVEEANMRGFALVQTYINAPSLEQAVKEGRKFSESELIELADRLLSILLYLHELNPPVIHRDIKPSNILLTNRSGNSIGDVYLVDFGSVQTVASVEGGTISIQGSYGYMPLEQFGGRTTTASDLYSLGMTLIYVITGIHPADLENVNGQVKFDASHLNGRFFRWLEKMTQPHLDRRFESTQSAQIALTSAQESYGDFLQLQPFSSTVQLQREHNHLQIKFTENKLVMPSFLRSLYWFGLIIFYPLLVFIVAIWGAFGVSIFMVVTFILYTIFEKFAKVNKCLGCKVILIEKSSRICKIGIYSEAKGETKWLRQPGYNSPIDLIIYQPSYRFDSYFDEAHRKIKSGSICSKPELSIYRNGNQYFISGNQLSDSDSELHWLGQEISDFLNLELQIIYPTPKVPKPEPLVPDNCVCI